MKVEVDLGRDAFAVCFDSGRVNEDRIERAIRALGFRPRQVRPEDLEVPGREGARGEAPDRVARVLARARDEGRFVLLEFFADWCPPCKVVEARILPHPRVKEALVNYILLPVDADEFPEVVDYFEISAMPTLLAVDADGVELRRFEGVPEPEELAAELEAARQEAP